MNTIHILFFIFAFLSSYTFHTISSATDFCVADLSLPKTPSGSYPCKPEANVTVDDFVFSGLVEGKPVAPFNSGLTSATVANLPGLNGLGIAAARVDVGVNGTVPIHSHPDASELIIIVEGELTVGFITPAKAYVKTVKPADVIVIPKGLLHFVINSGKEKAVTFGALSSSSPGVHVADFLLFGNDLPTSVIAQTTLLDVSQIEKLKAAFGGSG
ncbi:auxin-binding protein ABP19b-like [Vicia villosa]|uniref:auxin-binding protein ABP19b-like n=1 Tax=Vicia villosa TaxID=3911 RepID=UPI00273B2530|nr:auxin-binding protein ABP19b-like [Vicia villosa]